MAAPEPQTLFACKALLAKLATEFIMMAPLSNKQVSRHLAEAECLKRLLRPNSKTFDNLSQLRLV